VTDAMVHCRGCGKEIHPTAPTCPHCGALQRSGRYKNKVVAGILAIFFGALGVHRFYLGQWWGLLYILFLPTSIPMLVAFVEALVFFFSSDAKWDAKYNEGKPAGPGDKGGGALTVVFIVAAVMGLIALVGILAAIAIPAYQQYVVRAKVYSVREAVVPLQVRIEQYARTNKQLPVQGTEISRPGGPLAKHIAAMVVGPGGVVTVRMSKDAGPVAGKTVVFTPVLAGDAVHWICRGGTLEDRYLPKECRAAGDAEGRASGR